MNKRKLLEIKFKATKDFLIVKLKTAEEVEQYFKNLNSETFRSRSWFNERGEGVKFYRLPEMELPNYISSVGDRLFYFFDRQFANISLIRAVGVSKGVTLKTDRGLMNLDSITDWLKLFTQTFKIFYERYIAKQVFEGQIILLGNEKIEKEGEK